MLLLHWLDKKATSLIAGTRNLLALEQCTFCQRTVVDDKGEKTEDFGIVKRGKHVCIRCMKALEFSLGN